MCCGDFGDGDMKSAPVWKTRINKWVGEIEAPSTPHQQTFNKISNLFRTHHKIAQFAYP
jgi:hypothetical protein